MEPTDIQNLYSSSEKITMKIAEEARMPGKNRVEEIKNYARMSGIKRIGIANCISMQKEAEALKGMLGDEFEVHSIDCKVGRVPSSVFSAEAKGVSCNPAAQAEYLDENKTELNISMGLCVGHDMVFTSKSKVPVTTLIVKDREHKHNPMETFSTKN
jgi:uncharacterized metal-binding protein